MADVSGEVSVEIGASPERIYDYVVDLARHSEWNYQPGKILKTSEGEPGLGATYHAYERWPDVGTPMKLMMRVMYVPVMLLTGAKMETFATVTVADRPSRLVWEAHAPKRKGDMMRSRWELDFKPSGAGTKVTQRFTFMPQIRFPGAPPKSMIEGEVGRNLQHLKANMEAAEA